VARRSFTRRRLVAELAALRARFARIAGPPGGGSPFNRDKAPQRNKHMNRLDDPASSSELAALWARFARIVPTASPLKPFPWLCEVGLFEICRFHLCVCFQW
jgi:hypothetical protein